MRLMTIIMLLSLFISCGKNQGLWPTRSVAVASVSPAVPEKYSYELRDGNCNTDKHESGSFVKICQMLTDEDLNNNCAKEKRMDLFNKSSCEGSFN